MKGKRLLIIGAAVALTISGCASATRLTRGNPLRTVGNTVTIGSGNYESVYETGFENAPSGTTYNSTQTYDSTAGDGVSWNVYYGTVSTTNKITGSKSMHMRWYSSAKTNYPHAETTSSIANIKAFKFNYAVGNINLDFKVQYSTNGSTWSDIETVNTSDTDTNEYSHEFSEPISSFYFRVIVCDGTAPSSGNYTFRIDDVVFGKELSGVATYSVEYNANGGSGTMTDSNSPYEDGSSVTAKDNEFTRYGYNFVNWNTKADGSGDSYDEGESFDIETNTTLYAQWEEDPTISGMSGNPYTVAQARAAIDANTAVNNVCVEGIISQIDSYDANHQSITYWISDDGTTSNQLEVYSGKGLNGAVFSSKDDVEIGATVVVRGDLKKYNSTYEFNFDNYQLSYTKPAGVPATGIELNKTTLKIELGYERELTYTLSPAGAVGDVTWESSNEDVAIVDEGNIEAVGLGTATISAFVNGVVTPATCDITVVSVLNYGTQSNPLNIEQAKAVLDVYGADETRQPLYVKGIVSSNTKINTQYGNYDYVWLQSDDGETAQAFELYHVKLDSGVQGNFDAANSLNGYEVIAYGFGKIYDGKYELADSSNEPKKPLILSAELPVILPTSISLNKDEIEVEVGGNYELVATLAPAGASGTIVWSSSDESVADVVNGVVSGVAAGSATISASVDGVATPATCAVTVKPVDLSVLDCTLDLSTDTTKTATASSMTWEVDNVFGMEISKGSATTNANNYYPGTSGQSYTSTRFYKNSVLTVTPKVSAIVVKAEFLATTEGYATALKNSTFTNASAAVDSENAKLVVVTLEDGTQPFSATISATCGFTAVQVFYKESGQQIDDPNEYLNYAKSVASIRGSSSSDLEQSGTYSVSFANAGLNNDTPIPEIAIGPVTLSGQKQTAANAPAYFTNGHNIRVYQHNTIKFESATNITSIKFSFDSGYETGFTVSSGELVDNVWTGNATSVTFTNSNDTNKQVRFFAVEVTCGELLTVDSTVGLRFGASIPQADWEAIEEKWDISEYGVMLFKRAANTAYPNLTVEEAFNNHMNYSTAKVTSGALPDTDDEGNYIFSAQVNISSEAKYNVVFCSSAYIVVDGEYYFLDEMMEYSAITLAQHSLVEGNSNLSNAALSILANK